MNMTPRDRRDRRLFVIKCKGKDLGSKEMMRQLEKVLGQAQK